MVKGSAMATEFSRSEKSRVKPTASDFAGHVPPQNLIAEKSVLGSILLQSRAFDEVADFLLADHFYHHGHQLIYAAIKAIVEDNKQPVDPVTVAEHLDQKSQLEDVGGIEYLMEVLETVPHAANVKGYAEIVRDRWIQRSLTDACTEVLRDCYSGSDDTSEVLSRAEQKIFGILQEQERSSQIDMNTIMMQTLHRINARFDREGVISGLSTGFLDLDRQTNGFQAAELIILAARPSMGKTALVCNLAEAVATNGNTVLVFSLEQSKLELAERFLCIRARLDGHRLRKGDLDQAEKHALMTASSELSRVPLFIDDAPGRTVGQISAIARRLKRKNQLGLIIIDYLQLIEPEDKRAPREQQIAQITRRLKGIAKENEIPVIALSQLNRGVELREDKRPKMADLRESGAIEQDADIVMFLHRPDAYNPEDQPGLAEVIVAKHRSGPTGIVRLTWRREFMRFEDYSAMDAPDIAFSE
ncbi:replicative DNA helicase [Planctopirus limnophila DSM 3776]|uniref:Replicative DNA helicase n=2 Tax=Planctopirus TaxID=1649480 RepID=D5SQI6_PLAL2|nr:replicative DNA helicase [Planctopirus limnophila DSM 3776]